MARREDDPTGTDGEPQGPGRDALYQQVAQYYRDFLGRDGSPDEINGWLNSGQTIDGIRTGIQGSDEAKAHSAGPSTTPTPQPGDRAGGPPATPPPSGGGGLGPGSPFTQPFGGIFKPPPEPTGPPGWWKPPPTFTPPPYKQAPAFAAPTLEQALNEPGYQFAAQEGQHALERSAAARGVLGTGGTLKDLISYGQNFAQQQYGNVWNRAKDAYTTNYQTQYFDPYNASYKSALDVFQPQLLGWQNQMSATQRGAENDYTNAWSRYLQDYNAWRNQNIDVWGRYRDATNTGG